MDPKQAKQRREMAETENLAYLPEQMKHECGQFICFPGDCFVVILHNVGFASISFFCQ